MYSFEIESVIAMGYNRFSSSFRRPCSSVTTQLPNRIAFVGQVENRDNMFRRIGSKSEQKSHIRNSERRNTHPRQVECYLQPPIEYGSAADKACRIRSIKFVTVRDRAK